MSKRAEKIEKIILDNGEMISGTVKYWGKLAIDSEDLALAIDREFSVECEDEMNKAIIIQERWDAKQEVLDKLKKKVENMEMDVKMATSLQYADGHNSALDGVKWEIEQMKK